MVNQADIQNLLIASRKIALKSLVTLSYLTPSALSFTDGSNLEADTVIFCTGYQNGRTRTRKVFVTRSRVVLGRSGDMMRGAR